MCFQREQNHTVKVNIGNNIVYQRSLLRIYEVQHRPKRIYAVA